MADRQSLDNRLKLILTTLVAVYVAVIAGLAALGYFFFVFKTLVVPVLFLVAALSGRFKLFVRDWAIFLSLVVLFDSIRGYIFALVTQFDLPVYMGYAVAWEKALLGGRVLPALLQQWWFAGGEIGWLEKAFVVVHASHFLYFMFVALFVWFLRHEQFWRFAAAIIALMYIGLIGYLLIPTIPPWMAYSEFRVVEPVAHITADVYNLAIPTLHRAFDTNPIAAMPSLHAGFPMLCSLAAIHIFGRKATWTLCYALAVALSVAYLGEHYLVDILAGWLMAGIIYGLAFRTSLFERLSAELSRSQEETATERFAFSLKSSLLVAALFLVASEVIGYQKSSMLVDFVPSESFIASELEGRSPYVDYYRGRLAFKENDFERARDLLVNALPTIDDPAVAADATYVAARSAFELGDYSTAAAAFGRLTPTRLPSNDVLLLAVSYDKTGDLERRDAALEILQSRVPGDPTPLYWRTRLDFEGRRIDPDRVRERIADIRKLGTSRSEEYAAKLASMIEQH